MEFQDERQVKRQIEAALTTNDDPIAKVQAIVDLGVDEEVATEIVERYQIGQSAVVYYEQLPQHYD